jgi:hypothetical protein
MANPEGAKAGEPYQNPDVGRLPPESIASFPRRKALVGGVFSLVRFFCAKRNEHSPAGLALLKPSLVPFLQRNEQILHKPIVAFFTKNRRLFSNFF